MSRASKITNNTIVPLPIFSFIYNIPNKKLSIHLKGEQRRLQGIYSGTILELAACYIRKCSEYHFLKKIYYE